MTEHKRETLLDRELREVPAVYTFRVGPNGDRDEGRNIRSSPDDSFHSDEG